MKSKKKHFLDTFFLLFKAKILSIEEVKKDDIYGSLYWEGEEDTQDFRWVNFFNEEALSELKKICEFILKHDLNDNDRILISEEKLKEKLIASGWSSETAARSIRYLMIISIKMIDEGEETDSFFIHF